MHLTLLALIGLLTIQLGCERPEPSAKKGSAEIAVDPAGESGSGKSEPNADETSPSKEAEVEEAPAPTLILEGPADSNQDVDDSGQDVSKADQGLGDPDQDIVESDQDTGDEVQEFDDEWTDAAADAAAEAERKKRAEPTIEIADNWTRLSKDREVWVDKKTKQVMFAGHICLTAGQLEMFICPEGTKEHESIISSSALSSEIHMALLLIDCKPGKSSSWDPVYRPAHGPTIDATIKWRDAKSGKTKSIDAKQWIRDVDTKKAMAQRWIFGGSKFWKDPDTGEEVYYGDSGELICLSNFSTATIDVGVKSSQEASDGLLFEAFTENIPPIDTKVYTILTPGEIVKPAKIDKAKTPEAKGEKATAEAPKSIDVKSADSAEKPADAESVDARAGSETKKE